MFSREALFSCPPENMAKDSQREEAEGSEYFSFEARLIKKISLLLFWEDIIYAII
ncbi:MAG: hypothetical protein WC322_03490 [Candidatus Paceibacterota bacterium]